MALASGKATRTAGDLTQAFSGSITFIDATGMSVTISTGAHRCLVEVVAMGKASATDTVCLDLDIDGVRQGQDLGLCFADSLSGQNRNLSFAFLTDVLTAASHTFKLQFAAASNGTMTLYASTTVAALVLGVTEINSP